MIEIGVRTARSPPGPCPRPYLHSRVAAAQRLLTATLPTPCGNRYLGQVLGEAAVAAGRTNTFLGDRYRRLARRRGGARATVAVGRSILVIIWHLLADPDARYRDLGPDYVRQRTDPQRRTRSHVRQLEALGYAVTLTPVA
jgi:transposase